MGDKLTFDGGQMFSGGGEGGVGSIIVGSGSVLFQYKGPESSVYCQYIVSIWEYGGRV